MKTMALGLLIVIAAAGAAVAAETLTVKDVIALKELGYTDAQIKAEVQRTKSKLTLTDADVRALKQAGFGEAMIAMLKRGGTPAKKLSREELLKMLDAGRPVEAILDRILEGGAAIPMTMATALDLHRKKVPHAVIVALKGKPLTLAEIERLAGAGLSAKGWSKLAAIVGVAKAALAAADAVALVRAGVPRDIISRLKEGKPVAAPVPRGQEEPADDLEIFKDRPYVLTAAEKKFIADVEKKLAAGVPVDKADDRGMTALHKAAARNFKTAVEWLIKRGANINVTDGRSLTPLAVAAASGHLHAAKVLLEHGADAGIGGMSEEGKGEKTPLALAIEAKDKAMAKLLRRYGAPAVAITGGAEAEFRKRVEAAIEAGTTNAKLDAKGSALLHVAAEKGYASLISMLVTKGADLNAQDNDGLTPLMRAVRAGRRRCVYVLLENKSKLDIKDKAGKTAKQHAQETGNVNVIAMVTQAEQLRQWETLVNVRAKNMIVWKQILAGLTTTPNPELGEFEVLVGPKADEAALKKAKKIVDAGGDINAPDALGLTLLHQAAGRQAVKTAAFLIGKGANVNARGKNGHTPLHFAAAAGNMAMVELLLKAGADPKIRNAIGSTPADLAQRLGHQGIADVLRRHGG